MKLGRNDPCHCGSGKKYKNCCINSHFNSPPSQHSTYLISSKIAYMGSVGREREKWCKEFIEWKAERLKKIQNAQTEASLKSNKPISCSKGCSYCCSQHIAGSFQECEAIVYWLNQKPTVRDEFLKRYPIWRKKISENQQTYDQVSNTANLSLPNPNDSHARQLFFDAAEEYFKLDIKCPFLVDGLCSIYPVRPLACASHVVISNPENCKASNGQMCESLSWVDRHELHPAYFRGPANQALSTCVPHLVHEIMLGCFSYLDKLPGLAGIKREAGTDPEISSFFLQAGLRVPL